jgi:UPF0716 family protein affecting phage T7 exclusion
VTRVWLGLAALLVMAPNRTATIIGLLMAIPVVLQQWRARRREPIEVSAAR